MHYVPFLKIKQGEFAALNNLTNEVFDRIKPYHLFVDDTNEVRKGSYFETFSKPMSKIYQEKKHSCFVDFSQFKSISAIDICEYFRAESFNFTIVIKNLLVDSQIAEYLKTKNPAENGIAILFDASQQYNFNELNLRLNKLKEFLGVDSSSIDLILQFGYITSSQFGYHVAAFEKFKNTIDGFEDFRNVIIGAGSFPKDLGNFKSGTVTQIPRYELQLFQVLQKTLVRSLVYGDFGNLHSVYDPEAGGFEGSASLKYTTDENFVIYRGSKPSEHAEGFGQYVTQCKSLISSTYFDGANFSFGDDQIYKCGNGLLSKTGNATTWITNTLNHHITKVSDQQLQ